MIQQRVLPYTNFAMSIVLLNRHGVEGAKYANY